MASRIDQEVAKALAAAQGNRQLAQQVLLKNVLSDDELLRELIAPFLKAVTAQAIDRALRGTAQPVAKSAAPTPDRISPATAAKAAALLGGKYNPMKATQDVGLAPPPKRPAASARHVSTMKLLAAAFQYKRGERV